MRSIFLQKFRTNEPADEAGRRYGDFDDEIGSFWGFSGKLSNFFVFWSWKLKIKSGLGLVPIRPFPGSLIILGGLDWSRITD